MAFHESKQLLTATTFLAHCDPTLPITLACDASNYGSGAVSAHNLPDGSERPIGYTSRTLNAAERNYTQLKLEGLACVFGVKHFLLLCVWSPIRVNYRSQATIGTARGVHNHIPTSFCPDSTLVCVSLYV